MATLVDTNVLIDIAVRDKVWRDWSRKWLAICRDEGALILNQIVYAEFAYRYDTVEEVDAVLPPEEFRRSQLPWRAAFVAAKAFRRYRNDGGSRRRILPDFLIGAHAAIGGFAILSRDTAVYRSYFPTVPLIAPDTHS
jgi:predicted nucleic acid-binding protein